MSYALPFAFYLLALVAYAVHFVRRTPGTGRAATTLMVAAALAHTFVIGMQTMEIGHVPAAGTTQAISTFVWLLGLAYLYTEVATEERGLGVFVLALMVALQAVPAGRGPSIEPQSPVLDHPLFWTHVSALLGAYASFALAAVIGVTYVLQFKEIKARHLVFFFTRLPSLQVLDVMNTRTVLIGWILMTVGLASGAVWIADALAVVPADRRVQAMSLSDPKIFVAIMTWAVYAFQLVARPTIGWRGRKAAYLSAFGFAIVLLNFVLVSYFLTDSHNFGAGLRPAERRSLTLAEGARLRRAEWHALTRVEGAPSARWPAFGRAAYPREARPPEARSAEALTSAARPCRAKRALPKPRSGEA